MYTFLVRWRSKGKEYEKEYSNMGSAENAKRYLLRYGAKSVEIVVLLRDKRGNEENGKG